MAENKIYLVRMMTLDGAAAFEEAISGKDVAICEDVNYEAAYTPIEISYNEKVARVSSVVREKLENNRASTQKAHVYFMYSDDLHEALDNLATCALQPRSEEAVRRIEEGKPQEGDFFANGAVAICVLEVPEERFQQWIESGLAGKNDGNESYETVDGGKVSLPEAVLGDIAIKECIANGYLTRFGQSHKVYESVGLTAEDFDPYDVFDRSFESEMSVGIDENVDSNVAETSSSSNPYAGTLLEKTYKAIVMADLDWDERSRLLESLEFIATCNKEDQKFMLESIEESLKNPSYMGDDD